jgi:CRP/FNR family transcriptional regulator
MIRTISPNRASFGRCSACTVRSLSICGALDQTDLAEFERIARHIHFAPSEALFTAGQIAHSVHSLTAGVARLYKLLPDGRRQVIGFALPGSRHGAVRSLQLLGGRHRLRNGVPPLQRGVHAFH